MRASSMLFLVFVPIFGALGCAQAKMAAKRTRSDMSAMVPTAGMSAAKTVYAGEKFREVGGPGAAEAQARTAAFEPPPQIQRMIVRNGELSLRVKDIKVAEAQVRDVARSAGGVVEASQGSDLAGPSPSLSVTLRVPEPRFDSALENLEALGDRLGKTIASEDVMSQAVDLEARIRSLRVQEDAYRAILAATRRISDVLEVQERLTGVRTQIEQLVAERRGLGDQAARSKIVVNLSQIAAPIKPAATPVEPNWLGQTWADASSSLFAVGRSFASLTLWLAVMLPVWLPLSVLGWIGYRRLRTVHLA